MTGAATAALLLTAGDNPDRLANAALHRIVIIRQRFRAERSGPDRRGRDRRRNEARDLIELPVKGDRAARRFATRQSLATLDLPADDDQRLIVHLPADGATSAALDRLNSHRPDTLRVMSG